MASKNKDFDAKKFLKNIVTDINKLDGIISEQGKTKDLKSIDISSLRKGSTARTLKKTTDELIKMAEETSEKNRDKVEEISNQVKDSLKARQQKLESGLEELSKTDIKDKAEIMMIRSRISEDIRLKKRSLNRS